MAKDDEQPGGSPLERVLTALRPEDLDAVSRDTLENLQGMISDALKGREDDEADSKPLGQMTDAEFQNYSRRKGYAS